jgi:hypothetical protein
MRSRLPSDFALREDTSVLMRVAGPDGDGAATTTACCTCRAAATTCCRDSRSRPPDLPLYLGCAQRYLAGDAMAGILQAAAALDAEHGGEYAAQGAGRTGNTSAPPTWPSASP